MNITPLEIRQKTFETNFRGFDKEEVDAFLLSLSQEWERVNTTIRDQQIKLEGVEKELSKLREVESSLYKTLKTAEETSNNLIEQAHKSSELQMRETQMNTDALINDARILAKDMIDEAEAAIKDSFELMKEQVKSMEQDFKALENHRESMISELKSLANSVLDRVERSDKNKIDFNLKVDHNRKVNLKEVMEPLNTAFNALVRVKPSEKERPTLKTEARDEAKVEAARIVELDVNPALEERQSDSETPVVKKESTEPKTESGADKSFFDLD